MNISSTIFVIKFHIRKIQQFGTLYIPIIIQKGWTGYVLFYILTLTREEHNICDKRGT